MDREALTPFVGLAGAAESELAAACAIRRRYDEGVPEEAAALAGVVGRCEEAGRRLTEATESLRTLRALDRDPREALTVAETRFRELTARTAGADTALVGEAVTGCVERAKDSLVTATVHLNETHQALASDQLDEAAQRLRAAESAIARAEVLVTAVTRLRETRAEAARLIPPALTGAEAELAPSAAAPGPRARPAPGSRTPTRSWPPYDRRRRPDSRTTRSACCVGSCTRPRPSRAAGPECSRWPRGWSPGSPWPRRTAMWPCTGRRSVPRPGSCCRRRG